MLNNCQFKLNAKRERDGVGGAGVDQGERLILLSLCLQPLSFAHPELPCQHLFWAKLLAVSKGFRVSQVI